MSLGFNFLIREMGTKWHLFHRLVANMKLVYAKCLGKHLEHTQFSMNVNYYCSHHCYLPALLGELREIKNETVQRRSEMSGATMIKYPGDLSFKKKKCQT